MTEIEKARELFVSCRLKEAKPLLEELAGAGDSDALYMLAMMTYDVDIAIELLAKSAAKGNAGAKLMRLALMADASEETIAEAEKSIIPEIEKGAEEDPVLADALGTFYLVYGKKREGWTEKGMALLPWQSRKNTGKHRFTSEARSMSCAKIRWGMQTSSIRAKPSSISPLPL